MTPRTPRLRAVTARTATLGRLYVCVERDGQRVLVPVEHLTPDERRNYLYTKTQQQR